MKRAAYSAVWPAFLALAGATEGEMPRVSGVVTYEYGSEFGPADVPAVPARRRPSAVVQTSASKLSTRMRPSELAPQDAVVVEYAATRLSFRRDVIERLGESEMFRVVTSQGTFQMTRAEFDDVFANVVASRSYRENGLYHYPAVPHRAERFRR